MPKFRVDFVFDGSEPDVAFSREVDLPLDKAAYTTAVLDLGEEAYEEHNRLSHITIITALEDIPSNSIKIGDVVYRDWDDLTTNGIDEEKTRQLISEYKPIWEVGTGFSWLLEFLEG